MAKKIVCPNISHPSFQDLKNRLGNEYLAYYVWNEVGGNVSDNGLPFVDDFKLLDGNAQGLILDSLNDAERNSALLNIENAKGVLFADEKFRKNFSYRIETSDKKVLTLTEKRAAIDSITYQVCQALISSKTTKIVDAIGLAKTDFELLREDAYREMHALEKKSAKDNVNEIKNRQAIIRCYDKILDPTAWNRLQEEAVISLELNGIRFRPRGKNKSKLADIILNIDESAVDLASEGDIIESPFNSEASFGRDPKDFSAARIKAMMMGIQDTGKANLRVFTLLDQSYVYKQILSVLTAGPDYTRTGIMEKLSREAGKHPADNVYKYIYDMLKNDPNEQHRVQFEVAMNKVRNDFIEVILDRKKPSRSKATNANNDRAGNIVVKQWSSDVSLELSKIALLFDGDVNKLVEFINGVGKAFGNVGPALVGAETLDDRVNIIRPAAISMLSKIGIQLSEETYDSLISRQKDKTSYDKDNIEIYSKKNRYNLSARGFDKSHQDNGAFGSIAKILRSFNVKSLEEGYINEETVIDALITSLNQTGLKFLATIEGKNNKRYFQNAFHGMKQAGGNSGMRYNYKQPSPSNNFIRRLLFDRVFREERAGLVGNRKLFLFNGRYFGGSKTLSGSAVPLNPDFDNIFSTPENYGLKEHFTNSGLTRDNLNAVDLEYNSLILFQDGGSRYTRILDTAKADKKESPLYTVPRVEFDIAHTDESTGKQSLSDFIKYIDGELVISNNAKSMIMHSDLMANCMSVVASELDRITFALTLNDTSSATSYKDKVELLTRIYGKNYLFNSQFIYSMPFLNGLIDRNADGTIDVGVEGIKMRELNLNLPSTNEKFKEAIYNYFIDQIRGDIKNWMNLGLIKTGAKKLFSNLLVGRWAETKMYAPFINTSKSGQSVDIGPDDVVDADTDNIIDSESSTEVGAPPIAKIINNGDFSYISGIVDIDVVTLKEMTAYEINKEFQKNKNNDKQFKDIETKLNRLIGYMKFNDELLRVLSILSLERNMNTFSTMGAFGLLISGDPATSSKSMLSSINETKKALKLIGANNVDKNSIIVRAVDDFIGEYQKRLTADIAPATDVSQSYTINNSDGTKTVGSKNYRISFIADAETDAKEYLSSLPEEFRDKTDQYTSNGTDGMEYVSFYNKLDALYRSGRIKDRAFVELKRHYRETGNVLPQYLRKFFIGAGKPRQVGYLVKEVDGESISVKIFIKSAEIPLLAQFTESLNNGINNLRIAMEDGYDEDPASDQHIGRVVHITAAKSIKPEAAVIYGKGSSISWDIQSIHDKLHGTSELMPWISFGYQQETPTHTGEGTMTNVVQADKSILGGLGRVNIKFKNSTISGEKLDARKHSINAELSRFAKVGIDLELKDNNGKFDINEIVDGSVRAGSNTSNNDANSLLSIGKYNLPLLWSHARTNVEEFLFSTYSHAIHLTRPGRANPQFSIVGNGKVKVKDTTPGNGVIWLNGREPSEPLKYTKIVTNTNGELEIVRVAEIIVPFDFISMGKSIDINKIDLNNIDSSLLNIIGMRLPNQLHQSQILFKIVGFAPENMGTVCFVPMEITTQSGSDFDIDKLYQYWKNAVLTKDNKLVSIDKDIISYGENDEIIINDEIVDKFIAENFDDKNKPSKSDIIRQALENDYVEIFQSVLSNPEVVQKSLVSLDAPDLKNTGAKYFTLNPEPIWYSAQRQNKEYRAQQSANSGIDIFAKEMSSIILADNKELKFSNQSITKLRVGDSQVPLILSHINPYGHSVVGGEDRTSLRNIVILLSESIDNAKNGNLIPNGLNDSTFDIAATMVILSDFDGNALPLSYVPAILNQEIVKIVGEIIDNSRGVFSGTKNKISLDKAIKLASKRMADYLGINLIDAQTLSRKKSSITTSYNEDDLFDIYNVGQKLMGGNSLTNEEKVQYLSSQIDIMNNIFKPLSSMAKDIFKLNNNTSFDKGFDPSSAENRALMESINNGNSELRIDNKEKYIALSNGRLNTTGNNLRMANVIINDIDNVMGYNNPILKSIIQKITAFSTGTNADKNMLVNSIINNYKSYILTKVVREEFGVTDSMPTLAKKISNKLASLKNNSKYKNNKFILSTTNSRTGHNLSFNADLINNSDIAAAMDGFYALTTDIDDSIRSFAHNILMYELLTNGNNTRSSFTKVIPVDTLIMEGFYDKLTKKVNEQTVQTSSDEFINLFYRNNPEYAQSINSFYGKNKLFSKVADNFDENVKKHYVYHVGSFGRADIPLAISESITSGGVIYLYDSFVRTGDGLYRVYYNQYDGSILRGRAEKTYLDVKKYGRQIFDSGFYTDYSSDKISSSYYTGEYSEIGSFSDDFITEKTYFVNMLSEQRDIRSMIQVVRQIDNTYSRWITALINEFPDSVLDIPIKHVKDGRTAGSIAEFNIVDGRREIVVYSDSFEKMIDQSASMIFAKETMLHELHHAMMVESYNLGVGGDKRFKTMSKNIDSIFMDASNAVKDLNLIDSALGKEILYNGKALTYGEFVKNGKIEYVLKNGNSTSSTSTIAEELFGDNVGLKSAFKRALYMFNSQMDFVSELSSRKYIQDMMNNVYLSDAAYKKLGIEKSKSILQSLFEQFMNAFNSVITFFNGASVNSKSVLEATMMQNMMLTGEMITNKNKLLDPSAGNISEKYSLAELQSKQVLSGTIRDFLGGSTKTERNAFRYALNHNIFKTKC